MKTWTMLMLGIGLAFLLPTAQADLDVPGEVAVEEDLSGVKVCVENNAECYYVLPPGCVSGYDHDDDGQYVGYLCHRPTVGRCLFEYPDGDGTTCVVLLASNGAGETCVVNYSPWEYGSGYDRYACFS